MAEEKPYLLHLSGRQLDIIQRSLADSKRSLEILRNSNPNTKEISEDILSHRISEINTIVASIARQKENGRDI